MNNNKNKYLSISCKHLPDFPQHKSEVEVGTDIVEHHKLNMQEDSQMDRLQVVDMGHRPLA